MTGGPPVLSGPVPLAANNFTPLSRTPWAGDRIGRLYKDAVVTGAAGLAIGESWEFSCDPVFPSRLAAGGQELLALVEKNAAPILSPDLVARGVSCEILVKLLDTADALSLQVHPPDKDPNLKAGECGKPESWLILAAEPGAGIYLGFKQSFDRDALRKILTSGDAAKDALYFQPVAVGDYFEIEPGVAHLIGGGVTLLEAQRIVPGKSGKTYRLWDWGRKYDAEGRLDPKTGKARELHLDEALPLIDPRSQVGPAYAESLRRRPRVDQLPSGAKVEAFPANPYYQVSSVELRRGAPLALEILGGYGALVVLKGRLVAHGVPLSKGQSALLPHQAMPLQLKAEDDARFVVVAPATARVKYT